MLSYPDFSYKQIAVHIAGGSGEKLRFRADNILIENREGTTLLQHSCHRLFALFIIGEISLTSIAIQKAIAFAFPIILMNRNLKVVTRINCAAEGNTLLRKKQYQAQRNLSIAHNLIRQKIDNQLSLLQSLRKPALPDKSAIAAIQRLVPASATNLHELMGIEGAASKAYFSAYFRPLGWNRREPRCRRDIPNLLLDIGYTYLFNFIEALISLYGFDLFCGVHHTFFYQRKSLICDLVEPFRCIIDRRIRKAHNLRQIDPADFIFSQSQYKLEWKKQAHYTRLFLKDLLAEKQSLFHFCQSYYRWFIREKPLEEFPVYRIGE